VTEWQVDAATVRLTSADGTASAELQIAKLANRTTRLLDRAEDPARSSLQPAIQLFEASAYDYEFVGVEPAPGGLEPSELFEPGRSLVRGRISSGEAVGTVLVRVKPRDGGPELHGKIEVRPAKLADERAFQTMLSDLADVAVETLMLGFQPSAGAFDFAPEATPRLLYQQFTLLHLLLFRDDSEAAFAHVLRRPHRAWVTTTERRSAGRPLPGSSRLAHSLTRPGPRQSWSVGSTTTSLPLWIDVDTTAETLDTPANRFIKFALERWRDVALLAGEAVERDLKGAPRRRGRVEVARTIERLDELLAAPLFDDVQRMVTFPTGNPVLTRAEGYRQLLAMYLAVEAGAQLPDFVEDPFLISQRNIAALYEAWCFLQLVIAVGEVCGVNRRSELLQRETGGMSLKLVQGRNSQIVWTGVQRHGRSLQLELFFNLQFDGADSWTQRMRPDCSLLIRPRSGARYESEALDIWLHFDAKYKIEHFARQFGAAVGQVDTKEDEVAEDLGQHRRGDLLKMHAYRDAIRRSAGAFVLFPGGEPKQFQIANEVLPGLGAFPLTPGNANAGREGLVRYLNVVLDHAADQATRHERARFWDGRAYGESVDAPAAKAAMFLSEPPADTHVLMGYVRNTAHFEWIGSTRLYNVRGGTRAGAIANDDALELQARLLILWGPGVAEPVLGQRTTPWFPVDRAWMNNKGYPDPGGDAYFCCSFQPVDHTPEYLQGLDVRRLQHPEKRWGAPFATTWLEVLRALAAPTLD